MEAKTVFFYLIVAIAIAALIIGIVAVVQSNNNNNAIKTLQSQTVNYTALPSGKTTLITPGITASETTIYSIDVPLTNWEYTSQNVGILGNFYVPILFTVGTTSLTTVIYYSKNGGTKVALDGAVDFNTVTGGLVPFPVNINLNGVTKDTTFSKGDTLTLFINMATVGGTGTSATVPDAAMVYGPINV